MSFSTVVTSGLLMVGMGFISCNPAGKGNTSKSDSMNNSMDSAQNLNVTKFGTKPTKQQNAQYLMKVYAGGLYEISASKEAKKRSSDKEIKKLADYLIKAHINLNKKIKDLAVKKQISLPGSLTPEQADQLNRLLKEKEMPFVEDYLRQMVNDHEETINILNEAKQSTEADMIAWAKMTLPKIQAHLEKITTCQNQLDSLNEK